MVAPLAMPPEEIRVVVRDSSELAPLARLARWEVDCAQAGPGPLCASLAVAAWGSLRFTDQRCNRTLLSHGAVGAGTMAVAVPAHAGGRVVVGGEVLDDGHAIVARGTDEGYFVVGPDVRIVSVTLPCDLVEGAAADHASPPRDPPAGAPRLVRFPPAELRAVRTVIAAAFSREREHESPRVLEIRSAEIEEWLAQALVRGLHAEERLAARMPGRTNRVAYVDRACEYIEAHLSDVVRLADLARAVGVSIRTLEYAFRDVVGMSPLVYTRIRRLNRARRSLLAGRAGDTMVADVALAHGFGHLGYFARDYKALFGELPRETLARSAARGSPSPRAPDRPGARPRAVGLLRARAGTA